MNPCPSIAKCSVSQHITISVWGTVVKEKMWDVGLSCATVWKHKERWVLLQMKRDTVCRALKYDRIVAEWPWDGRNLFIPSCVFFASVKILDSNLMEPPSVMISPCEWRLERGNVHHQFEPFIKDGLCGTLGLACKACVVFFRYTWWYTSPYM